jgi:hypothetical protein
MLLAFIEEALEKPNGDEEEIEDKEEVKVVLEVDIDENDAGSKRTLTLNIALNGFSSLNEVEIGPNTLHSTEVFPCVHRTLPSARCNCEVCIPIGRS